MSEPKLTQKDTLGQESIGSLGKRVVSYSTFLDLLDSMGGVIENVDFFVDVAFQMDAWEKSMPFIHDQIENARKELSEIGKKALRERDNLPTNVGNKSQPAETIEDTKKADEDTPGQEDEGIINKADDSVMKRLDNVLCKAEVLEKAFKGFEQWDLNGVDAPKFDHSFFAGLAIMTGDINKEINDIANDLV